MFKWNHGTYLISRYIDQGFISAFGLYLGLYLLPVSIYYIVIYIKKNKYV